MTIDERLEVLLQSTESLHASTQELHATAQAHAEQLAAQFAVNEKRWERVRSVVRAALAASIQDDEEEDEDDEAR